MEDPRWLRLVTIGLILMALAVGYFLFSGRLSSNSATRTESQANRVVQSPTLTVTPAPTPTVLGRNTLVTPTPSSSSAYLRIVNRNQAQGGVQTLPRTGFPIGLTAIFSASAIISGWGLRKFPH